MQEYTRCSLGSPSDRLKAIKGILSLITENSPCRGVRFIRGLPAERFDLALLEKSFTCATITPKLTRQSLSWSWGSWFANSGPSTYYDMSDFWATGSLRTSIVWYTLELDGGSTPLRDMYEHTPEKPIYGLPPGFNQSNPMILPSHYIHIIGCCLHFLTTIAHFRIGAQLPWDERRTATQPSQTQSTPSCKLEQRIRSTKSSIVQGVASDM